MSDPLINHGIRNSLFVDLFQYDEHAKENFLSLYNAIHDTNLKLEDTVIEAANIKQVLYMNYQNDVSMKINGQLVILVEHQSTINNNMPLRFLLYVARIYESIVPTKSRYKKRMQKIPSPEFYVLYNGEDYCKEEYELKLSEAFIMNQEDPALELKVKFFNIKNTSNPKLKVLQNCSILKEYSQFIEFVSQYAPSREPEGLKKAINAAIEQNILKDYLQKRGSEVLNMLIAEYSYEEDIAVQREEAYEEGIEKGIKKGLETKGINDAVLIINKYKLKIDDVCKDLNVPKQLVLEALKAE